MRPAFILLYLAMAMPASVQAQSSAGNSGSQQAADFSLPFAVCAVMAGDGPDVVTIYVNPETKTVTAMIVTSGSYSLKAMPALLSQDTMAFGDDRADWALNRTTLTLTRVMRNSSTPAVTKPCKRFVLDDSGQ